MDMLKDYDSDLETLVCDEKFEQHDEKHVIMQSIERSSVLEPLTNDNSREYRDRVTVGGVYIRCRRNNFPKDDEYLEVCNNLKQMMYAESEFVAHKYDTNFFQIAAWKCHFPDDLWEEIYSFDQHIFNANNLSDYQDYRFFVDNVMGIDGQVFEMCLWDHSSSFPTGVPQ